MAVNAYLIIDGTPGPSTSVTNAIDILSFSFGASMHSTMGVGSSGLGHSAGRANLADLNIMKVLDKTSVALFDHCVTGNVLTKVTLEYYKPVGNAQAPYFKIELADAMITSQQLSGSSENPMESLSFAYQKVTVSFAPDKEDGTLDGFVDKSYDLSTLKAS